MLVVRQNPRNARQAFINEHGRKQHATAPKRKPADAEVDFLITHSFLERAMLRKPQASEYFSLIPRLGTATNSVLMTSIAETGANGRLP